MKLTKGQLNMLHTVLATVGGTRLNFSNGNHGKIEGMTWDNPVTKVKKEGWLNMYPPNRYTHIGLCGGIVFETKELADAVAQSDRTACLQIEWEEDAK